MSPPSDASNGVSQSIATPVGKARGVPQASRLIGAAADLLRRPGTHLTSWLSMDKRLVVLFVALIALVIGRGVMLMMSLSELEARQAAVERSDAFGAMLADYVSQLKDAETGQRGYVLTGDQSYLEPYRDAIQAIRRHDADLK